MHLLLRRMGIRRLKARMLHLLLCDTHEELWRLERVRSLCCARVYTAEISFRTLESLWHGRRWRLDTDELEAEIVSWRRLRARAPNIFSVEAVG